MGSVKCSRYYTFTEAVNEMEKERDRDRNEYTHFGIYSDDSNIIEGQYVIFLSSDGVFMDGYCEYAVMTPNHLSAIYVKVEEIEHEDLGMYKYCEEV